jgi:dual specificity MAP kinase phosphatase
LDNGENHSEENLLFYNVFVLTSTLPEMLESLPHLLSRVQDVRIVGGKTMPVSGSGAYTDGPDAHIRVREEDDDHGTILKANTINFAQREKDEMRDLTKATEILSTPSLPDHLTASSPSTHWDPSLGQIFLGNVNDVPIADEWMSSQSNQSHFEDPFDYHSNDPAQGYGYDICIECRDYNYFPTSAHIRAADEHLAILDATWCRRYEDSHEIPIRPPPNANSVVHFSFPCSPPSTGGSISALAPFISFLDRWLHMPGVDAESIPSARKRGMTFSPSSLPPATSSFMSGFFASAASGTYTRLRSTSASYSSHGFPTSYQPRSQAAFRTRPMKVLIYSSDGYTESSFLALCLLMAMRGLSLPQAYLELQVVKRRSFFVYQTDLGLLKWVEAELCKDRGSSGTTCHQYTNGFEVGNEVVWSSSKGGDSAMAIGSEDDTHSHSTRSLGSLEQHQQQVGRYPNGFRRPRASTLPMMPAFADHQLWLNDPRFNGSFPSRVLPFLYLGDLWVFILSCHCLA